jgi:hypothetical protein
MLTLKLDNEEWYQGDYTLTTGNGVGFTIYTEEKMVNVKNLTGYTLESEDCDIVTAGSGTGEFLPIDGNLNVNFIGEVRVVLSKSGEQLTAIGTNGSGKLRIRN